MTFNSAVSLNFDHSFVHPDRMECLDFTAEQERLRYACSVDELEQWSAALSPSVRGRSTYFLGSGDFHHLTYGLLRDCSLHGGSMLDRGERDLHLVVLDNHPDNMLYLAGIHCGSWVHHAAALPNVARVSVIGITSSDIKGINMLQNHYPSLRSGKVEYFCLAPVPPVVRFLSRGYAHSTDHKDLPALFAALAASRRQVWLSIDKDVLAPATAPTTWDQGVMTESDLLAAIAAFGPKLVGADICGEPSEYTFKSPLKSWLRRFDGVVSDHTNMAEARAVHSALNFRLLESLEKFSIK